MPEAEPVAVSGAETDPAARDGTDSCVRALRAPSARVPEGAVDAGAPPSGRRFSSSAEGGRVELPGADGWAPGGVAAPVSPYRSAGPSAPPMPVTSGAVAAWARSPDPRSIEARVSPPPAKATAVATRARRWVFFHRASCRRRAARPVGADDAGGASSGGTSPGGTSLAGAGPSAVPSPGRPAPGRLEPPEGATTAAAASGAVAPGTGWPPIAAGAMSGA
ncbi:hypothetical protein ABT157_26255 [Streptomyces viridosporus]